MRIGSGRKIEETRRRAGMKSDLLLRHVRRDISHIADWLARGAAMLAAMVKGEAAGRPVRVRIDERGEPHMRDFRRRGTDRWRLR